MDDTSIAAWLNARRKAIVGALAMAAILLASVRGADVVLQAVYALLGVYGIHEVANDA
jgi:hypothetical protein